MAEIPLTLADLERTLGPLTPDEQEWVLGRLGVTAPSALAEALSALAQRRSGDGRLSIPTVRGGPPLDEAAEAEYREERRT
ncbi:hypothetical protein [Streptosporangium sp. NPDC048865]|uniref:hypothetical protein n=1 Tax=Streptosporangium sp. NPDC048865 TaxID=3155766 RepID=UPI00343D8C2E